MRDLLFEHLTKNDFSIRARLARVAKGVDTDANDLAHPLDGFDVDILI